MYESEGPKATIHAERAEEVVARESTGRVLQVPDQVELLDHDVDRLHGLLNDLEDRLASGGIVQAEPDASKLETALDVLVPLADRIRHQRHRVQAAADRISSLVSRLEV